jgi:DNA primase
LIISEDQINQIKERTDIVGVIGEYVNLKSSGQNYKGLCPFHSEKTPSFMVSPQKNIFHCFGCGVGGNVFNFLMKFKGISFPDSVKMLGERVGIRVTASKSEKKFAAKQDVLYQINKKASRAYERALFSSHGRKAVEYLKKRSIDTDIIKSFKLGYAPDRWDAMLNYLKAEGFSYEKIEDAGLVIKKKSGSGYYDRFRNRIIFPIQDNIGRVIGFGGRTFDSSDPNSPKYLNTVENTVFHKGRYLYGFNESAEFIRKEGSLFIVEGYIDVIRMHREGIKNTVAPLGTALTEDHISYVMRYVRKIYLAFDSDEAGIKAALRSVTLMHKKGIDPLVIRLPSGKDPGDFFDEYTPKDFKILVDDAISGVDFLVKNYVTGEKEYTANEKIAILRSLSEYYENMNDEILKLELERRSALALKLEESIIQRELIKLTTNNKNLHLTPALQKGSGYAGTDPKYAKELPGSTIKNKKREPSEEKGISTELHLLLLILNNPDLLPKVSGRIDEGFFRGKWTRKLWNSITRASKNRAWDSGTVFDYIEDEKYIEYLSGKLVEDTLYSNPEDQLTDVMSKLKELRIREKIEIINSRLREAELENNEDLTTDLMIEKQVYSNELEKIKYLWNSKKDR